MTFFTPPNRFTAASIFRAGLFVLFFIGFLQPVALKADPIVFQATTLTSSACGVSIAGDNFDVNYEYGQNSCGGRPVSVGIPLLPLPPARSSYTYEPFLVTGTVDVPGAPDRLAVAYGGGQPSLYKDVYPTYLPDDFSGEVAVNVVLSGTVQLCLEPAYVQTPGQVVACDPAYLNFGVIDINVAGQAIYSAHYGSIDARGMQLFTATSAAAPEPGQLGFTGGAALLLWVVVTQKKWRGHSNV